MAQTSDTKLSRIAVGISIVALVMSAYCMLSCCRHRQPRGLHDGMPQHHEDFRRGGDHAQRGDFHNGPRPDDMRRGMPSHGGEHDQPAQPRPEQKQ